MQTFEIQEEFLLDGKPMKIMSGAIHYFRVHPTDWYHSLYNLKALGFNTVETYVPWNMHEPKKGVFDFEAGLAIEKFLETAAELGLYAIVRPSPYICAEWEFGGLPAWLLEEPQIRIRSSDEGYLRHVAAYYDELLKRLVPHQLDHGGNVLMFQVENEYGSYGEDKDYLRAVRQLMLARGITMPLFTSDGPWRATQRAGSMIEEGVFSTGNFGSKGAENFRDMQDFFDEYDKKWPLMCMEFWDGWFNRWHEPIIRRDPEELAEAVKETLALGSVNLYMFHGGTNFGFMNGCSARGEIDLPQVASYDYDAPLDEQGNPTAKYDALYRMIATEYPEIEQREPLIKKTIAQSEFPVTNRVSLFATLDSLAEKQTSKYPQTMEALGQNTGYVLYRTQVERDGKEEFYRVIDARDRLQFYVNQAWQETQYQTEIGDKIYVMLEEPENQLDLLIENMGRVNYGSKLLASTQHKGIRTGVMADLHFITNWTQYCLPLDSTAGIDFSGEWQAGQPAFHQYRVDLAEVGDAFLDMTGFGKGIAFVNGVNIGRFWEVGPHMSLYIPHGLWQQGQNEIVIFETEGKAQAKIRLTDTPIIKELEEEIK